MEGNECGKALSVRRSCVCPFHCRMTAPISATLLIPPSFEVESGGTTRSGFGWRLNSVTVFLFPDDDLGCTAYATLEVKSQNRRRLRVHVVGSSLWLRGFSADYRQEASQWAATYFWPSCSA
jgi:hypothetical protein